MIDLEQLSDLELRSAIEKNFFEILNTNPSTFEEYFKNIYNKYNSNNNMVAGIYRNKILNDGFAIKFPTLFFNISKFIFNKQNLSYEFSSIPIIFYHNNKDKYMDLMKVALKNYGNNILGIKSMLNRTYKNTNDKFFYYVSILLERKNEDYIDAAKIFANIDNIYDLREIMINWEHYSNLYYKKVLLNTNDLNIQKNELCKKIYNVTIDEAKEKYYQYIISNTTLGLNEDLIFCEKIIKATTTKELIQLYNESSDLENKLKSTFNNVADKIDIESKHSISQASNYEVSDTLKVNQINNTSIYDISESNFNLIIHNISPGLSHKEISEKISTDVGFWSKSDVNGSITISCSEISNKFLGHLSRKKNGIPEVIFAFTDIPDKEVFFASASDMGFATKIKDYSNLSSGDVKGHHYLADQLMTNCFFHYNEVVINRFEDQTKTNKRLPNYIVCYDEINNLSLQYAEYFNIPILFINTRKCAYKTANAIKDKLQKETTANELLNNINELLSFISGLTYSKTIFEIVDTYDWEQIIIDAIKNNLENIENIDMAKNLLLIIDYLEQNCNKFLDNLSRQFNDYSNENYDEVINKFSNLPEKISTIKQMLFNETKLKIENDIEIINPLEDNESSIDSTQNFKL